MIFQVQASEFEVQRFAFSIQLKPATLMYCLGMFRSQGLRFKIKDEQVLC